MTLPNEGVANHGRQLRLWPGVAVVLLALLVRYGLPLIAPDRSIEAVLAEPVGGLLVLLWWLLFSRARWIERLAALILIPAMMFGTRQILDPSIATGAQRMLFAILAIPTLGLAFVVWAVATRNLSDRIRWATMVVAILIGSGGWALMRTGGFSSGDLHHDLHLRWSKTKEDLLVERSDLPVAAKLLKKEDNSVNPPAVSGHPLNHPPEVRPDVPPVAARPVGAAVSAAGTPIAANWPSFRGPHHDGTVSGLQIKTDWSAAPPVAIWRRPVGPGWSSFAVVGDRLYTQEQRGPDEVVACYNLNSGKPIWAHRDAARFWESNGGPGPRGTPTLSGGRVYTFGATGILNVLDAATGALVWTRNAASDARMTTPQWGFASSPLVTDDLVVVGVSGRLAAYDLATGAPRWMGPDHGTSYSSPVLLNVDGVQQVLLLSAAGATGVALADGGLLWELPWKGYPIVQPSLMPDGDILISVTENSGIKRLGIAHDAGAWKVNERWTSHGLKPYFNDFVLHQGYAYGFDGNILSCIDLKDGQRKWKGGRFGGGQLVLLADQDLLLVISEQGELGLVRAVPDGFTEIVRVPAIEGKTWNHPAVAGDILLVRNGEEMVAFRLSRAGG